MTDSNPAQDPLAGASREQMTSALFANLVLQQANMALMFLGKVAHPQSGKAVTDLEAARVFIDQLEMLEAKTKGNLSTQETALLKQSLASVRMAFVEAVEHPAPPATTASPASTEDTAAGVEKPIQPASGSATATEETESRKKFTKKY